MGTTHDGPHADLTSRIIACVIEVHRILGPGLLESAYEEALCVELKLAGLKFRRQVSRTGFYKGHVIGRYRADLIVEDAVIVDLKAVERFDPIFEAILLTYLRVYKRKVGLILNFNTRLLKDGIKRYVL